MENSHPIIQILLKYISKYTNFILILISMKIHTTASGKILTMLITGSRRDKEKKVRCFAYIF